MRQSKEKKFHHLKFKSKQPKQFFATKKENAPTESLDSKTPSERLYAAAVKKSKIQTNLYLRRALSKNSTPDKLKDLSYNS